MLQHETTEVSDQAVTRLALALYEADLEETRKRQALAQAAQELGVPPHYLELAREQLRKSGAVHQREAANLLRRPGVVPVLLAFFIALLGVLFFLLRSSREVLTPATPEFMSAPIPPAAATSPQTAPLPTPPPRLPGR